MSAACHCHRAAASVTSSGRLFVRTLHHATPHSVPGTNVLRSASSLTSGLGVGARVGERRVGGRKGGGWPRGVPRGASASSGSRGTTRVPGEGTSARDDVPSSGRTRRHVVVLCHDVSPQAAAGLFFPSNLLQGRIDVWCRCITAALYVSDDLRRDTLVSLVLSPSSPEGSWGGTRSSSTRGEGCGGRGGEKEDGRDGGRGTDFPRVRLVQVDGSTVISLAPAETVVALLLQQALQHASLAKLSRLNREREAAQRAAATPKPGRGEGEEAFRRKSDRNSSRREQAWLAKQPGSRGPVPGITVSDFPNIEGCLRHVLDVDGVSRGRGGEEDVERSPPVMLLDIDGAPFPRVLERFVADAEGYPGVGGETKGWGDDEGDASDGSGAPSRWRGPLTFVLGDDVGVTPEERRSLLAPLPSSDAVATTTRALGFGAVPVTVGPRMLLASHCIVLAHAGMDAMEDAER